MIIFIKPNKRPVIERVMLSLVLKPKYCVENLNINGTENIKYRIRNLIFDPNNLDTNLLYIIG